MSEVGMLLEQATASLASLSGERLEAERTALGPYIKDIFAEAKSAGFDVKVIRQIIRIRRQEPSDVEEQETLLEVYKRALGM